MSTSLGLLHELAQEYEEATTREDQLASLSRAVLGWSGVRYSDQRWIGEKLREGEHLSFLGELCFVAPEPQEELQNELLDFALPLLEERGRCNAHLYEVLYCARVSSTTFRYFGKLLDRAEHCSAEALKVVARLLDSEDKWGHTASVDTRLRFQELLRLRGRDSRNLNLQIVLAQCAGVEASPTVSDPYLDGLRELLESLPQQLRVWWFPHYYGHGAGLTGRIKGRLRLKEESLEWLIGSLGHERLRFFATYLLQKSVRLTIPRRFHPTLREQYRRSRESPPWCFFGRRIGVWRQGDWARFLVAHTEHENLTSLFLEKPTDWFALALISAHRWCQECFGEVGQYQALITLLGARGLIFYRFGPDGLQWAGLLGESWVGPPLQEDDFWGEDVVTTTTLSPLKPLDRAFGLTDKAFLVCAVAHLKLDQDGSRGVFAFRPLRSDSTEATHGVFRDGDFEAAKGWRDATLGWVEPSED